MCLSLSSFDDWIVFRLSAFCAQNLIYELDDRFTGRDALEEIKVNSSPVELQVISCLRAGRQTLELRCRRTHTGHPSEQVQIASVGV